MTELHRLSHRRTLSIALPIVVSNVTVPVLGLVDTGVVGQIGEAAPIGAVGLGAVVVASVYWLFGFLRMGTTGFAAQALGAGDTAEAGAVLLRALLIALAGGMLLVLLQWPLIAIVLEAAPGSADVETLTRQYLAIRLWGAPAAIGLFAVTGWLIACERTRGVLVLQVVVNGFNILLDLLFVLGFGWGVPGVAVATIIAEWSGLFFGLWLCREAFRGERWRDPARVFDRRRVRRLMSVNGDILMRSALLQICFTSFLFIGAGFGDATLAANQVLWQFVSFTAFALDGFAFAAETLVGGACGAGQRGRVREAARLTSSWGLGLTIPLGLAFWIAGPPLIALLAKATEVRIAAALYLPWVAITPLLSAPAYMLDGIFIGAMRTRDMRNAMALATVAYAVACILLIPPLGNHGLWCALIVLNIARGGLLLRRYPALEASVAPPATTAPA